MMCYINLRFTYLLTIVQHYVVAQFPEQFNMSLDWVLSHWAHFTVLRFIFVYLYFVYAYFVLIIRCIIVTWRDGPEVIEA